MPPKMLKKWMHREPEALSMGAGREASLSPGFGSGGARGHELDGIFGGAGTGRGSLGIRNGDDHSYRRTFSIFFHTLLFEY